MDDTGFADVMEAMPMPEYDYFRKRVEEINDKVLTLAGQMKGHEEICAERYGQLLKDIAEIRSIIWMAMKIAALGFLVLGGIELGKATFPALFDLLTHH